MIRIAMRIQEFLKEFFTTARWGTFNEFCWQLENLSTNAYEFCERWDVSLATNRSILALIRITIRIQEFYRNFYHCGIGPIENLRDQLLLAKVCILRVFLVYLFINVKCNIIQWNGIHSYLSVKPIGVNIKSNDV